MKRKVTLNVLICIFLSMCSNGYADAASSITVQAQQYSTIPMVIVIIDKGHHAQGDTSEIYQVAQYLKKCFEFTEHFAPQVMYLDKEPLRNDVKKWGEQGMYAVLFLSRDTQNESIEWRLYDAQQITMLQGKRYHTRGTSVRGWAYNLADTIVPQLTGLPTFFSTRIAYCKAEREGKGNELAKHIYVADYDGSNAQCLTHHGTNIAPRWNKDSYNPLLFYSQFTPANIRLVTVTLHGKRFLAVQGNDSVMSPSFSHDGKAVVYCAGNAHMPCQLFLYKQGMLTQLTHNDAVNVSPWLTKKGNALYFCSDVENKRPHIYCLDLNTLRVEPIITDGYCACPSYADEQRRLVFTKMIKGTMQLYMYDCATGEQKQLTFDSGDKDECSWSACGNYILFSVENNGKGRIALMHFPTRHIRYITPPGQSCSYPSWSPVYTNFPVFAI